MDSKRRRIDLPEECDEYLTKASMQTGMKKTSLLTLFLEHAEKYHMENQDWERDLTRQMKERATKKDREIVQSYKFYSSNPAWKDYRCDRCGESTWHKWVHAQVFSDGWRTYLCEDCLVESRSDKALFKLGHEKRTIKKEILGGRKELKELSEEINRLTDWKRALMGDNNLLLRLREMYKHLEDYMNQMALMNQEEDASRLQNLIGKSDAILKLAERLRREEEERLLKRAMKGKKVEEPFVA